MTVTQAPATTQSILLVEDNPEDFEATMRAFRRSGLHNPISRCVDGDEALDYLLGRGRFEAEGAPELPGLILLDLNLPGTDGRDVLNIIKADARLRKIPVIVLTTSDSDLDIEHCYAAGANSYVQKPVDLTGFVHAIERLKEYWFEIVILPRDSGSG